LDQGAESTHEKPHDTDDNYALAVSTRLVCKWRVKKDVVLSSATASASGGLFHNCSVCIVQAYYSEYVLLNLLSAPYYLTFIY